MTFLWPEMLWLLLAAPLLVAFYFWLLQRRKKNAIRYASLSLVKVALGPAHRLRRHIPPRSFCSRSSRRSSRSPARPRSSRCRRSSRRSCWRWTSPSAWAPRTSIPTGLRRRNWPRNRLSRTIRPRPASGSSRSARPRRWSNPPRTTAKTCWRQSTVSSYSAVPPRAARSTSRSRRSFPMQASTSSRWCSRGGSRDLRRRSFDPSRNPRSRRRSGSQSRQGRTRRR